MPGVIDPFPVLATERLILRQIGRDDQASVYQGLSHPDVVRYYGVQFGTFEATAEQMDWFEDLEREGTGIWWAVCSRENGKFVGAGGFNNWSQTHRKAEVGFWLLPQFWGRGYMREAMTTMLDFGFSKLGLHRIEGFVENENINCKKVIEKLGFTHEGTMHECEIKDGRFIDLDIYAFLA